MTTAKTVTGRENKLTTKKRRATELCHITETIVNKRCGVRRGGHSSQDHPQIPRTRSFCLCVCHPASPPAFGWLLLSAHFSQRRRRRSRSGCPYPISTTRCIRADLV